MPPQYALLLLYSQIELYWLLLLFYQLATTFYHYQKQDNKKNKPGKGVFSTMPFEQYAAWPAPVLDST